MFLGKTPSASLKSGKKKPNNAARPWVSKYRPKNVEEVVYQDEVISTLKKSIETGNLPHLLFYGPPGTGKTSTILAVAYELYGPPDAEGNVYKDCVLELNASDERGIDVIRKKVKTFAQATVAAPSASSPYPCPPYKLIILDEADSMTSDAQHALRRTMETYSTVTRFCLLCNYVTRIIEPLTSRTAKFRFKPLKAELVTKKLSEIATAEGLTNISEDILAKLNELCQGDLRKAINYLQSAYRLYGTSLKPSHIDDMSGNVPTDRMAKFLTRCRVSKSYKEIQDLTQDLINDGYPANQVLSQLHDLIVPLQDMSDVHKATVLTCLAECDKALIDGAGEFLQLLHVASTLMKAR